MFVIIIDYVADLAAIDAALPAHNAWLDEQYDAGRFLTSGPRAPRTGGVIVAAKQGRAELETAVAHDPFALHGLATHSIIEFSATRRASRGPDAPV